ncbi:hypothetical protein J6590_062101 [Homalodisca vitripennis]|nr:hypothetical protein J6590_062101 [Homalodisca vitripennis]
MNTYSFLHGGGSILAGSETEVERYYNSSKLSSFGAKMIPVDDLVIHIALYCSFKHMNCKSKSVSSEPGNFPYPEQLRSYWVVNRQESAEVASGTTLLPGVRCSELQSCQGFERVKLA